MVVELNTPRNADTKLYYPIANNLEAKTNLVVNNPDLAARMFTVFRDLDIGKMFVARYADNPQYNNTAFFIGLEIGVKANRIIGPLLVNVQTFGEQPSGKDPNDYNLHFCGNHIHSENFWMENQWGNVVKAFEEVL